MRASLARALASALGTEVRGARPLGGGCISEAFVCDLEDGRQVFVKANDDCDPSMFCAEARGLAFLREAEAVRVPEVIAVDDEDSSEPFLVLEYVRPGSPGPHFSDELGRGLARLHGCTPTGFGLDHPNLLATLPQDNHSEDDWPTFYVERRLRPFVRRAVDQQIAPARWTQRFEPLFGRMADLVGDAEAPARLHGDLWSGNVHVDEDGAPVLIDPAVYGGHREIDLAMLELFGSPGPRFYGAYDEIWPLAPGRSERVALYQLYPLLAHVLLFGGSYLQQTESCLSRYL